MAIMDGLPGSQNDTMAAHTAMSPLFTEWSEGGDISPRVKSIIDLMGEGMSLAQIHGITRRQLDALFIEASRLLQAGKTGSARDILVRLFQLDPLTARTLYALGLCAQVEGDPETAGRLYIHFLGLDATNVDGYLRLAECFLANGEVQHAADTFDTALALAGAGHGTAAQIDYGTRMATIARERLASH
ncbi:hypothetical protein [Chthonobacter rhizosphaerae]|uniref:hypothetical protein n=1 Tax=Chthonobacter rhizosphaerae TaxID=2735553 RepID=UPI0015EEAE6C|nr:hypothetical protein [Chthonobacter rhizosphaerae]